MKQKMLLLLVVVMASLSIAACGKTAECFFCREEKRCTTETLWGQEINVCSDCRDELEEAANEIFG